MTKLRLSSFSSPQEKHDATGTTSPYSHLRLPYSGKSGEVISGASSPGCLRSHCQDPEGLVWKCGNTSIKHAFGRGRLWENHDEFGVILFSDRSIVSRCFKMLQVISTPENPLTIPRDNELVKGPEWEHLSRVTANMNCVKTWTFQVPWKLTWSLARHTWRLMKTFPALLHFWSPLTCQRKSCFASNSQRDWDTEQ